MRWKNKELVTVEDLMRKGIDRCNTPEEAAEFMRLYVLENLNARANIGYLAGHYDHKDKHRIYEWFDVVHPIFGRKDPTYKEAMDFGIESGKRMANPETYKTADVNVLEYIRADININGPEALLP